MDTPAPEHVPVWIASRYRVVAPLGSGGLGVVYSGWDHELNRPVAIKRVKPRDDADCWRILEEAFHEARALSILRHPHVVRLHDFGQDAEGPYFVMEHVDGCTLQARIDQGPVPMNEFRHIAHMALEGLSAAHRLGLLHLDIKPSNLMLHRNADGRLNLKVLDFGLSRFQESAPGEAPPQSMVYGTYLYIAPEQIRRRALDARTDLYALGHVLYHTLARMPAFTGPSIQAVLQMHLSKNPPDVREVRGDVSEDLALWLARMMAREPAERFADAPAALRELARISIGSVLREEAESGLVSKMAKRTTSSIRKLIGGAFGAQSG